MAARKKSTRKKKSRTSRPRVAILMGSQSDWSVMQAAEKALDDLGIESDARVISAHRTPDRLTAYLADAEERGIEVIIAGAGMAAHLAGVTAAHTLLPVLGVPIGGSAVDVDGLVGHLGRRGEPGLARGIGKGPGADPGGIRRPEPDAGVAVEGQDVGLADVEVAPRDGAVDLDALDVPGKMVVRG